MTHMTDADIWGVILAIGVGTFLIRFSFLGLLGARELPDWVLRHLRYTAVSILPALIAPLVIWPAATDGQLDPARLCAATAALAVGYLTKNSLWAITAGLGTFYPLLALLG